MKLINVGDEKLAKIITRSNRSVGLKSGDKTTALRALSRCHFPSVAWFPFLGLTREFPS